MDENAVVDVTEVIPTSADEVGQLWMQVQDVVAVWGLKVVAADGRRDVAEMEQFSRAMEAIDVSPEIMHRAFDRYFAETMPGPRPCSSIMERQTASRSSGSKPSNRS